MIQKEYFEKIKPLDIWRKNNHPCPNCKINKKDHWDTIHYNCEGNHCHNCKILLDFETEYDNFKKTFFKENKIEPT